MTEQRFYTDAPEAYDYSYVTRMPSGFEYEGARGWVKLDVVVIPSEHVDYQLGRYGSGLHVAWEPSKVQEALGYGFVRFANDQ